MSRHVVGEHSIVYRVKLLSGKTKTYNSRHGAYMKLAGQQLFRELGGLVEGERKAEVDPKYPTCVCDVEAFMGDDGTGYFPPPPDYCDFHHLVNEGDYKGELTRVAAVLKAEDQAMDLPEVPGVTPDRELTLDVLGSLRMAVNQDADRDDARRLRRAVQDVIELAEGKL